VPNRDFSWHQTVSLATSGVAATGFLDGKILAII
jgi:hypothetical protein